MTATTFSEAAGDDEPARAAHPSTAAAASSRRWRSTWRIHFYAGMFAMPFIVLMALTGLVILYTQPIQDLTQGDIRTVSGEGEFVPYNEQALAVEDAFPDEAILAMTVPPDGGHATKFNVDDGSVSGRDVFVDPYTAEVLGSTDPGGGIVGFANRLHGFLNNETVTVPLPSVGALWDGEPVMRDYVVGDLVLELLGVWTVVLVVSGLYLWWPRKSRDGSEARNGRRLLGLRLSKKGRARWRDLHGLAGVLAFSLLLITIVSGLAWSTYWGPNFTALANRVSPNSFVEAPNSTAAVRSDLDRLGNRIPWNTGDFPIPASYATPADGTAPVPLSLDSVVAIAEEEGMLSGYTVYVPGNSEDEAGNPVFGSFMVTNSWPRKTGEARDLYLDQFTGETLAEQAAWGYGTVSKGLDTLVSFHMGTELGLFSRISMTAMCLLAIWSVVSAFVMYWKRRRKRSLGLPRRPADVRLERRIGVLLVGMGIVFPQWAVSALAILALDRFVIRKVRPLRVAFGQP